MPGTPTREPDLITVLVAILDSLDRVGTRLETLNDQVRAARNGIDRLWLPAGHETHPEFDEGAPMWLLERHRDGKPTGLYFPANCATVAGLSVPTKWLCDALRFGTRAEAERFAAQDRRFAAYRVVPDPVERDDPDDDDAPRLFR